MKNKVHNTIILIKMNIIMDTLNLPDFIQNEIKRLSTTRKGIDDEICRQLFKYID